THAVLVSSGRSGQTGSIGLENVGITTNSRGHILVNEHFQTNQPHIYAAGDVIGNPSLASTAMAQGRIAVYHAFGLKQSVHFPSLLPSGLYTIPECSSAGHSEDQLNESKIPYVVGKASYANNARGQIIGDTEGFLKLLFHRESKKLLGVHVIGEGATEIVHIGLTVMVMDGGVDVFIDTCYNYPTISEVYKYASYDALSKFDKIDESSQETS
ncbi:Si-specific NAD(P)(+) transhydrogenase, partial [bacterium]|nr:Si-specific NAD(P)(+) transhydrogenase [bacterium]